MKNYMFIGIAIVMLTFCLVYTGCDPNSGNTQVADPSAFPFPQGSASLATYAIKPMLPTDKAGAEQKMINLTKEILNNNLIFDSRVPLTKSKFRIVLEHHTSYPTNGTTIIEQHITVSESMGYGMLLLAYMAGSEAALTTAGHTWRFGADSLKDYYDGMLRTVLSFQSPLQGRNTKQHSWELFGYNTGRNDTGLSVNNISTNHTRGFRYLEDSNTSPKIAPFANTPAGGPNGGGGTTGYNNTGTSSATDGDMDIIYSLIVADKQWGSDGKYNYKELALEMLDGFYEYVVHKAYSTLLLGDWAYNATPNTATSALRNGTRPSDFILSHLRAYKAIDTKNDWQAVIDATLNVIIDVRDALHADDAPNNGLLPDFAVRSTVTADKWIPAPSGFLEGTNDGRYSWNSCRTPWRLGTDYLLYGDTPMPSGSLTNPSLYTYSIKPLNDFAKARVGEDTNNMAGLNAGYSLDAPLANATQGANAGFAAPFLVTAAAVGGDQAWVDAFWVHSGTFSFMNDWYGDYYKLITMITASGNFWKPEAVN